MISSRTLAPSIDELEEPCALPPDGDADMTDAPIPAAERQDSAGERNVSHPGSHLPIDY